MVEPSTGLSKRPRVETTIGDMPAEEIPFDSTVVVVDDGIDDVDVETSDVDPTIPPPLSLRAMMETFMNTQAAHGQLLDKLIIEVASLRVDFTEYRSAFPPPPPSNS